MDMGYYYGYNGRRKAQQQWAHHSSEECSRKQWHIHEKTRTNVVVAMLFNELLFFPF